MVMEINCASHRSRKFLFLRRVRNPPDGVATFMKQSPQVTMLVYLYRYPSHARAPAWYAVRPLLLVIISAVRISRNADQYQHPGVRPANHSFHMDVVFAGVTDLLCQDALALGSCVLSFFTLLVELVLYNILLHCFGYLVFDRSAFCNPQTQVGSRDIQLRC